MTEYKDVSNYLELKGLIAAIGKRLGALEDKVKVLEGEE